MENKEELVTQFLEHLRKTVFVRSTNSVTLETEELNPAIEDREETVLIDGEWDKQDIIAALTLADKQGYLRAKVEGMTECHSPARIVAFIRKQKELSKAEGRRVGQLDPRSKTVINARLEVIAEVEKLVEENKFNDSWGVDAIYVDIFLGKLRSLKTNSK